MHCICDRLALSEALQVLQNIIGTNSTLPILSNILIEITETKELALTATNLEVGIQFKLDAEIKEKGTCTLPGKKFFEIAKGLVGEKIEIEVSSDNIGVIKSGSAVYRLMGLASEEFPRLPRLDKVNSIKINEKDLKDLFRKTSYAISTDETRYVLNGVYFIISKGEISVVATDGRRLAMVTKKEAVEPDLEVGIIIPAKTVHELMRILTGDNELEILFSETQVGFKKDNMLMISRLIEGKFPKYEQVIPKSSKEQVQIDREKFLNLVRRVSLITSMKSNQVKFRFNDGSVTVTASNPDIGEAKDDMSLNYKGNDFSIAFNPVYVCDALKSLEEETVTLELSESTLPGVIKADDTFTYVIMPMKLK
ncbi:DNA polymerase III subunit beta [bacterium]|nr:DNA polymerase III subunit beta [bacterium]